MSLILNNDDPSIHYSSGWGSDHSTASSPGTYSLTYGPSSQHSTNSGSVIIGNIGVCGTIQTSNNQGFQIKYAIDSGTPVTPMPGPPDQGCFMRPAGVSVSLDTMTMAVSIQIMDENLSFRFDRLNLVLEGSPSIPSNAPPPNPPISNIAALPPTSLATAIGPVSVGSLPNNIITFSSASHSSASNASTSTSKFKSSSAISTSNTFPPLASSQTQSFFGSATSSSLVAFSPSTISTSSTSSEPSAPPPLSRHHIPLIDIILGTVSVLLIIIVAVVFLVLRRWRRKRNKPRPPQQCNLLIASSPTASFVDDQTDGIVNGDLPSVLDITVLHPPPVSATGVTAATVGEAATLNGDGTRVDIAPQAGNHNRKQAPPPALPRLFLPILERSSAARYDSTPRMEDLPSPPESEPSVYSVASFSEWSAPPPYSPR
ncbi:hypothetical protein BXZ70DRAFT_770239 [Cristinia sonorae]|uniref:Uncharacterized protein n=1 Tax=Cristinia sonorae TaxID=1940300 RepID=A0A8K0XS63_9AGAR|nr:hypothetical protein BXZ70DRAFT_770239 [Cristinia sonorae]